MPVVAACRLSLVPALMLMVARGAERGARVCIGAGCAVLLLAGCAATPPVPAAVTANTGAAAADALVLSGTLSYRPRIALAPDSVAIIELRERAEGTGRVLAEQRIELHGRQVPIEFALTVDRARLPASGPFGLRGGIVERGRPAWVSAAISIDPAAGSRELGMVQLNQATAAALSSYLQCGPLRVVLSPGAGAMRMQVATETFELRPVPAASGAKYVAADDPTTGFWSKGDSALVQIRGKPYPECRAVGEGSSVFRAGGNEPGWYLELGQRSLQLVMDNGRRIDGGSPAVVVDGAVRRYRTQVNGKDLAVMLEDRVCADSMSGQPYPVTVEVVFDGRMLSGCGGDPADLLQGEAWRIEAIAGADLIEDSTVTLEFGPDGRVAGAATCNNYHGDYALSGEGLAISRLAGTLRACSSALMAQEKVLLEVLAQVSRFEITADGALVLHAADNRSIRARRD